MNAFIKNHLAKIGGSMLIAALGATALPLAASAQVAPGGEIAGTIQSINGTFNLSVLDANGYVDNVELHQGTIINPTGLTLAPGMNVTILGYNAGNVFDANEIDAPYQYSGALPTPEYYGPGFWYPGFAYGYGPSFSLVLGNGPYVERQPWIGHWWVPTPVHAYVGERWPVNRPAPAVRYQPAPAPAVRYNTAPAARYHPEPVARTYTHVTAPSARFSGGQRASGGAHAMSTDHRR